MNHFWPVLFKINNTGKDVYVDFLMPLFQKNQTIHYLKWFKE